MKIIIAIFFSLAVTVFADYESTAPVSADAKIQEEINSLVSSFFEGSISPEKISDPNSIRSSLDFNQEGFLDQLMLSFFLSSTLPDESFTVKKMIWNVAAKNDLFNHVTTSSRFLASSDSNVAASVIEVMKATDYPESGKRWDFSRYRPILEATKEQPFDRLIAYILQQSPGDGLKQLVDVYGDDISAERKRHIVRKGLEITDHLRNHGSLFELRSSPEESFAEGSMGQRALDFFLELKGLDKWYLDAFIVTVLEKSGSPNVSPDLIEYFESKPDSLANKLRQDGGIASLPPQKISLESLKNEQGKERENRLRGNNPDNLGKREISSRSDEKSQRQEEIAELKKSSLPWIIAGVLLVGILFLVLKTFKSKSTS